MKPVTRYTKSGSINIAYQVFGSGARDLVYVPGWISNIDLMWACPELVGFLLELAKTFRVILFDKRGTGLSDRIVEFSTLEERMDDIRAVMDAVSSEKAILFGHSEGGSASALFAATYPERTHSLITFGIFAKRRYSTDYPWAPTDAERQVVYDMIENSWGSGDMQLESLAPSKAKDKTFMDWLAQYFRSGASPSAALILTQMNTQVDIIDILGSIKVPSLIMQRTDDIDVKIEEGRFIADRIPTATYVEFEGSDHLFWVGNTTEVIKEIQDFASGVTPEQSHKERLLTVVSGKILSPQTSHSHLPQFVSDIIEKNHGNRVLFSKNTFVSVFEGPSKAVECCINLMSLLKSLSVNMALVIDMTEGSISNGLPDVDKLPHSIEQTLKKADTSQIFISPVVKHLLSSLDFQFSKKTVHTDTQFYAVSDSEDTPETNPPTPLMRNDSLLEQVLSVIENNYKDENFGVDQLCKEVGIGERQLQRRLKRITNKSPIQLISSVRLQQAKRLLDAGRLNVSEVAYSSGFSSPSYFTKCFKKEFGSSPSDMQEG